MAEKEEDEQPRIDDLTKELILLASIEKIDLTKEDDIQK